MQNFNEKALAVTAEVSKAVLGKPEVVLKIMMAMLARGHVLIEDIPGVGKTTLAQAFARAMDLTQNRVQFTPDVLPSDIVGFSLYQKETGKFVYHPGAVACNLFLADEINRTSARTQSALLEVMEEGAVTVDGVTRALPQPFTVMATENPVGSVGTQMLPESQLDRFMVCVVMGYPDAEAEMEILARQPRHALLDRVQPVMDKNELLAMQQYASAKAGTQSQETEIFFIFPAVAGKVFTPAGKVYIVADKAGKPQLISQIAEIFFNTLAVIATDVECADDPAGIGIYIHRQRNTNAQQWTGKFCQNRLQIIRQFVIFFLRRKVGKGARFKPQDASGQVSYTNFDRAALHQLTGTLRVAHDQEDVLAGGCLVNDCNGLVQRKEPDAAAGAFRGGGHQALLQRVGSSQIICHNNKVTPGKAVVHATPTCPCTKRLSILVIKISGISFSSL